MKHLRKARERSAGFYAPRHRGFTIIEASLSTLIVGIMLVAALHTVGATRTGRVATADRALGQLLAQQLISEVLHHPYEDPDGSPLFGIEADELNTPRDSFDDVDDFDGFTASPPQYSNGTTMDGLAGWRRDVHVDWVARADHSTVSVSETGLKFVRVYVYKSDIAVGFTGAIRTKAGDIILDQP